MENNDNGYLKDNGEGKVQGARPLSTRGLAPFGLAGMRAAKVFEVDESPKGQGQRQKYQQINRTLSHLAGFMMMVLEGFHVKESQYREANSAENQQVEGRFSHLNLLCRKRFYSNTNADENQSQRKTQGEIIDRERTSGDYTQYKNTHTQFSGIVEKFGEIVANAFCHRQQSIRSGVRGQ